LLVAAQSNATSYRADIDGLRALSIVLVVGYHALPWLTSDGFIGVDIFFVISGFLITGIILTELEAGTFSPLKFYARRVRRIFPALIVVLLATYLIGWFVLLPDGFSLLGENIAAGVAFVSNLFQLRHAGYFAPGASENPLLHLWSLGIEEQFYILWPPALLLMAGSDRRRRWMAGLALLSFGVSLLIFLGYKEWSFYSPPLMFLDLAKECTRALLSIVNIQYWRESHQYFASNSDELALLHCWSLSLEEQIWPLFIVAAGRMGRPFQAIAIAALASWLGSVFVSTSDALAAFFLPLRIFEFALAALEQIERTDAPIIYAQLWRLYDDASINDDFDRGQSVPSTKDAFRKLQSALERTIGRLVATGHRVLLLGAQIDPGCFINVSRLQQGLLPHAALAPCPLITKQAAERAVGPIDRVLGSVSAKWPDKVTVLRPVDYFCDGECPVVRDGIWLHTGRIHLSIVGSDYMASRVSQVSR
jgi:peptidoglycan/LPS O-acetylase OafA/YrhL